MEIEFKYQIESSEQAENIFSDPSIVAITDENSEETLDLHAIYFDTEDRRLSREGITFRTRREGESYVATLKWNGSSENGLYEREEINIPLCDTDRFENPNIDIFAQSSMCDTIRNLVGNRELRKRVEVKFLRRQIRIDTGKSISELSYDKGIVLNGDKEAPISEMELELYSGDRSDMEALGRMLEEKYNLSPGTRSKFKQGLALED